MIGIGSYRTSNRLTLVQLWGKIDLDAHLTRQTVLAFSTTERNWTFPTAIPFSIQKSTDSIEAFGLDLNPKKTTLPMCAKRTQGETHMKPNLTFPTTIRF